MKYKAVLLILTTWLVLFACSPKATTKVNADAITQADVDRAVKMYSDVTYDDLVKGQSLYKDNCDNCHGLKKPSYTNEEGWRKIVPDMSNKVNRKAGSTVLAAKEQEQIIRYLVTMGSR